MALVLLVLPLFVCWLNRSHHSRFTTPLRHLFHCRQFSQRITTSPTGHWARTTTVVMVALELGWIGEADARAADILELCGYSVTNNASVRANTPVPPPRPSHR